MLFLGLGPQSEYDEELVCDDPLFFIKSKHLTKEGDSATSFLVFISILTFATTSFLFTILGRCSNEGALILVEPRQGSRAFLATEFSSLLSSAIFSKVEHRVGSVG